MTLLLPVTGFGHVWQPTERERETEKRGRREVLKRYKISLCLCVFDDSGET